MHRIDWKDGALRSLPAALILLMTLMVAQIPLPFYGASIPFLPVISAAYYWSLFRPTALPLTVLAIIALLHDIVYGMPLGSSVITLITIRMAAVWLSRRLRLQKFLSAWLMFMPVVLWSFLLLSLFQSWVRNMSLLGVMSDYIILLFLTWLSYPLLHLFFNWCYRQLPALSYRELVQ